MKLLFVSPMFKSSELFDAFAHALPHAELIAWHPDLPTTGAEYAVGWQPSAQLFDAEPQLKVFFNLGAGVDAILKHTNLPSSLQIVRLEDGGMAAQIAEYALYAVTGISRQLITYQSQQKNGLWQPLAPIDRSEWAVGVMGLGVIGQKIAHTFSGLDYPTLGWSRQSKTLANVDCYHGQHGLSEFLKRSRVLVNILPLTADTHGILDKQLFAQLPEHAYLINVGRGDHLNETDLINALDAGHLAGACLDVFSTEPLPKDHPFWTHPKITITPHISGQTLKHAAITQISQKIIAMQQGLPVSGTVDRQKGY